MKGGEALEFREMPRAKSEHWRIQVQQRGAEYPGGGGGSGSSLRGGTGFPLQFHPGLAGPQGAEYDHLQ